MTDIPSVWHVTREYAGLAEAGGIKDVVRGLAEASVRAGIETSVVLPRYGFLPDTLTRGTPVAEFQISLPDHDRGDQFFDEPVRMFSHVEQGVRIFLVDSPRYASKRNVYTYTEADHASNEWQKPGTGHWDSHQLNLILQRATLETLLAIDEHLAPMPRIIHCHDGHAAFLPAIARELVRYRGRLADTGLVLTIHNAGKGYHQEVWDRGFARLLTGLDPTVLAKGSIGRTVDPLLLAGSYASVVTVSEQYARELLAERADELSGGLGRAFRERGIDLRGVTNGLDPSPWDPRGLAAGLPQRFDPSTGDLAGKRACREALASRVGLSRRATPAPLFAFVGRLTGQKGIDILLEALGSLLSEGAMLQCVVLGQGEAADEQRMAGLARAHAGTLSFVPRYDAELSRLIYAASDFFLVPSAYEPCGLTDFIAQIAGSVPIVHRVGGLVKVRDGETGLSYDEQSAAALGGQIRRACGLFQDHPEVLERIRVTAFNEIFRLHTWDRVLATGYLPEYRTAVERWTLR